MAGSGPSSIECYRLLPLQSGGHHQRPGQRIPSHWSAHPSASKGRRADFRGRENPKARSTVTRAGQATVLMGGLLKDVQIAGNCGFFGQGPGCALKSSPVQTRCAPLAAACGFTLDRAEIPSHRNAPQALVPLRPMPSSSSRAMQRLP